MITEEDLQRIFRGFARRKVVEAFSVTKEFESSTFRQPELYGLPVFAVGYGGKTVAYLGQYIAHKVIRERDAGGRVKTKWRILTGFVRIFAKHREDEIYIEVLANGAPSAGILEYLNNKDQYILIEDKKIVSEVECYEEDIINLSNVMNYEDSVILIDTTGLLRNVPTDVFSRMIEITTIMKAQEKALVDAEQTIEDLRTELEFTKAENRTLRLELDKLRTRLVAISGVLMHYKTELLKQKELLMFYTERLEAVSEGKEKLRAVISDFYEIVDTFSEITQEISDKIEAIEKLAEDVERLYVRVKELEGAKLKKEIDRKEEKHEKKEEEKGKKEVVIDLEER